VSLPQEMAAIDGDGSVDDRLVALMDRYERSLYRFLYVLLGDCDVATDCTQDTFVRAYDNLRKGKPVNARWLFTVGRNRAMDEFRRQRREPHGLEALEGSMTDSQAEPHLWLGMREAFAQLTPDDRTVLYLSAVEGLSGAEIGEMLDLKTTAVRVRISRARRRFKLAYGGVT